MVQVGKVGKTKVEVDVQVAKDWHDLRKKVEVVVQVRDGRT